MRADKSFVCNLLDAKESTKEATRCSPTYKEDIDMPGGRPSIYTPELAGAICARIAAGESLMSISKDAAMPGLRTIWQWLADDIEFRHEYACARETQADVLADEIVAIADDKSEDANSRRVRVDARKWVAAKLKPKRYGDRLEVAAEVRRPLVELSDEELRQIAAQARAKLPKPVE